MYQSIIVYGLSDVYICKDDGIPIPLKGALDLEINISDNKTYAYLGGIEKVVMGSDKKADGVLSVLGLTNENLSLLLGYKQDKNGGVIINDGTDAPKLHLLFSRSCADGSKNLYHVFNVKFSLPNINANTLIEGNLEEDSITLSLDIEYSREYEGFYYMLNSNNNQEIARNFFNELQYPQY